MHISNQYQQLKIEEHFRICEKIQLKIFPFFKIHSQNKYLREQSEKCFREVYTNVTLVTSSKFLLENNVDLKTSD